MNELRFAYVGNPQWGQFLRLSSSLLRWEWDSPSKVLEHLQEPTVQVRYDGLDVLCREIDRGVRAIANIGARGWVVDTDRGKRRILDLSNDPDLGQKKEESIPAVEVFYPLLSVVSYLLRAAGKKRSGVMFFNTDRPVDLSTPGGTVLVHGDILAQSRRRGGSR